MRTLDEEVEETLRSQMHSKLVKFDYHFSTDQVSDGLRRVLGSSSNYSVEPTADPKAYSVIWPSVSLVLTAPIDLVYEHSKGAPIVMDDVFPKGYELSVRFTWYPPGTLYIEILVRNRRACMFIMSYKGNVLTISDYHPLDSLVEIKQLKSELKGTFILTILDYMIRKTPENVPSTEIREFFDKSTQSETSFIFFDDCEPEDIFKMDDAFKDIFTVNVKEYICESDYGQQQLSDLIYYRIDIERKSTRSSRIAQETGSSYIARSGNQENAATIHTKLPDGTEILLPFEFDIIQGDLLELRVKLTTEVKPNLWFRVIELLSLGFFWEILLYTWPGGVFESAMSIFSFRGDNISLSEGMLDDLNTLFDSKNIPLEVETRSEAIIVKTNFKVTNSPNLNTGRRTREVILSRLKKDIANMDRLYEEVLKLIGAITIFPDTCPVIGRPGEEIDEDVINKEEPEVRLKMKEYNESVVQVQKTRKELAENSIQLRDLLAYEEVGVGKKRKYTEPPSKKALAFQAVRRTAGLMSVAGLFSAVPGGNYIQNAFIAINVAEIFRSFLSK